MTDWQGIGAITASGHTMVYPRQRPTVTRGCSRCGVTDEDVRARLVIVSPTGLAHFGEDDGDTSCGIRATSDGWWWPE